MNRVKYPLTLDVRPYMSDPKVRVCGGRGVGMEIFAFFTPLPKKNPLLTAVSFFFRAPAVVN